MDSHGILARPTSRADFIRGAFGGRIPARRPPWSLPEAEFVVACSGCGRCVSACPEGIVVSGRGGLPEVDFARGGCDFCGACADVCAPGVLDRGRATPWTAKARVLDVCLSARGIECRVCGEHCEARAIAFQPVPGAVAKPIVDVTVCSGCGACWAPCPVDAIAIDAMPREGRR